MATFFYDEDILAEDLCPDYRFGPMFDAEIRKRRIEGMRSSHWRWHLDKMFVKINGGMYYLWRTVDHEREVQESFVTKTRNRKAAFKFLRKAMRRHGRPEVIFTDKPTSTRNAASPVEISSRSGAPPLSPSGGRFVPAKCVLTAANRDRLDFV